MNYKRVLALLLLVLMLCGLTAQAANKESSPLIWQVTDAQGHTLYLFGTIHVAVPDLYPLPDAVMAAYNTSDALALELDITTASFEMLTLPDYADIMYLPQGDEIANHLSADTLAQLTDHLNAIGYPAEMVKQMSPAALYTLLDSQLMQKTTLDPMQGVDMHLATLAREQDKPLLEVESAAAQLQMLGSFSDELYDLLISSLLETVDLYPRQLAMMYEVWRQGNETLLTMMSSTSTDGLPPEQALLMDEYNQKLIIDRNITMADFAETQLASGDTVFMAVGAAHMVGPDGIVKLLQDRGYTVTKIEY